MPGAFLLQCKSVFNGFCIEVVNSGTFDGTQMLEEATQVSSYSLASRIDLCGKHGLTVLSKKGKENNRVSVK